MPTLETDVLAEIIHRKTRCLAQLRALGEKQLASTMSGSMSDLLDVLALKQQVLLQLQRIERELDPFRDQVPESRRWASPQARQQCAADLAECEAILADVVRQEKQSEQELVRRRDEAAAQLRGTQSASQARRAYLAPTAGPSQLDLSSGTY